MIYSRKSARNCSRAISDGGNSQGTFMADQDFGARVAVTMGERLVPALEILRFVGR